MPIASRTAAQYAEDIGAAIKAENPAIDTMVGPVPDIVIKPVARVAASQNARLKQVSDLICLIASGNYTDADLDEFILNEGMSRIPAAGASVVLTFYRTTVPTSDLPVLAGFPVATLADEETGNAITYIARESKTLRKSSAAAYYRDGRWELDVVATAVPEGSRTNVGPLRIVRPLRTLVGFDGVTNKDSARGGRDEETREDCILRYMISLMGTSPGSVGNISKRLLAEYPDVTEHLLIYGSNKLLTRAATDAGAIDIYVTGTSEERFTETLLFMGRGQSHALKNVPVASITSVTSNGITYEPEVDYKLAKDEGGRGGSYLSRDSLVFTFNGNAPASGDLITIEYVANTLIRSIQGTWTQKDHDVPGHDILFKQATRRDWVLDATIKALSGYSTSEIADAARVAILDWSSEAKLGVNVEGSDIQGVVRAIGGVDNFIIRRLHLVGGAGNADIEIGPGEYARLLESNLNLEQVI